MNNAIKSTTSHGKVKVELLKVSDFQKEGTQTAQLRQVFTTIAEYRSKQANNSLTDNVFGNEAFGFKNQEFKSVSNRVAFVNVPLVDDKGNPLTLEMVQAAYDKYGTSVIYRILSSRPILTDSQKYAIRVGLRTLDQIADRQVARYAQNEANDAKGISGQLVLSPAGKVMYRGLFFSKLPKADIDQQTPAMEDTYMSPTIREEFVAMGDTTPQATEIPTTDLVVEEQIAEGQEA